MSLNKILSLSILAFLSFQAVGQDYSLGEAISYGLENSNEIKMEMLNASEASSDVDEYRAIGIPKINAGIDYSYYFKVPVSPVEDFIGPSVYGVLFQEGVIPERDLGEPQVFEFGFFQPHNLTGKIEASGIIYSAAYKNGLKAIKLYNELISSQRELSEQEIRVNVTKAYLGVLIAERNLKVMEDNIKNLEKILADTKEIYKNGFAESLDVYRLEASLKSLVNEKNNITKLIYLSKNALKFQMGYPLADEIFLTETLDVLEEKTTIDLVTMPLEVNPEKRAEYRLLNKNQELNEVNLNVTKSGYYPSATAFISGQESLQRTNLFDNNEAGWLPTLVAGVSINIPIYDGGEKKAKMQKNRIAIEKNDLEKDNFRRAMTLQVNNAVETLKTAKATLDSNTEILQLSQKIYDTTKIKFNEGVGSSVELNQAESGLYQAQGAYINSLYELLSSKVELETALGIL